MSSIFLSQEWHVVFKKMINDESSISYVPIMLLLLLVD